jgi:hypothetical protein
LLVLVAVGCSAQSPGAAERRAESTEALDPVRAYLDWSAPVVAFDTGSHVAAALGVTSNGTPWEVEVHQGDPNDLWVSGGIGPLSGMQPLGPAAWYSSGYAPAIAANWPVNSILLGSSVGANFIEVHQDGPDVGPISYAMGYLTETGALKFGAWSHIPALGDSGGGDAGGVDPAVGIEPRIAVGGDFVVEVHQLGKGVGPLVYHYGLGNSWGYVRWIGGGTYDQGMSPSVAITQPTANAPSVAIEVHSGGDGTLWYHVGTLTDGGVSWGPSMKYVYDHGYAPSVTTAGGFVAEVHQATTGKGDLLSNFGSITGATVAWQGPVDYGIGYAPSITWDAAASSLQVGGREVHAFDTGTTSLLSTDVHVKYTTAPPPPPPCVPTPPAICNTACGKYPDGCGGTTTCSGCCTRGHVYCDGACKLPDLCSVP